MDPTIASFNSMITNTVNSVMNYKLQMAMLNKDAATASASVPAANPPAGTTSNPTKSVTTNTMLMLGAAALLVVVLLVKKG